MLHRVVVRGAELACGPRPGRRSFPDLERAGCNAVLTLLSEHEGARAVQAAVEQRRWRWFWIPLGSAAPTEPGSAEEVRLREAVAELVAALHAGLRIYVHCSAGLHRTGVIVAAILLSTGSTPEAALRALDALRPLMRQSLTAERWDWACRLATTAADPAPRSWEPRR